MKDLDTYIIVVVVTSIPQYAALAEIGRINLHDPRASSVTAREGRVFGFGPDALVERCAVSGKEHMCDSRGLFRKSLREALCKLGVSRRVGFLIGKSAWVAFCNSSG